MQTTNVYQHNLLRAWCSHSNVFVTIGPHAARIRPFVRSSACVTAWRLLFRTQHSGESFMARIVYSPLMSAWCLVQVIVVPGFGINDIRRVSFAQIAHKTTRATQPAPKHQPPFWLIWPNHTPCGSGAQKRRTGIRFLNADDSRSINCCCAATMHTNGRIRKTMQMH